MVGNNEDYSTWYLQCMLGICFCFVLSESVSVCFLGSDSKKKVCAFILVFSPSKFFVDACFAMFLFTISATVGFIDRDTLTLGDLESEVLIELGFFDFEYSSEFIVSNICVSDISEQFVEDVCSFWFVNIGDDFCDLLFAQCAGMFDGVFSIIVDDHEKKDAMRFVHHLVLMFVGCDLMGGRFACRGRNDLLLFEVRLGLCSLTLNFSPPLVENPVSYSY